MPRRYHKSYGDWISTMSFFGVSVYACLKGLEFIDQGNLIRASLLLVASVLCLLGSLRYPIARFFDEINKRSKRIAKKYYEDWILALKTKAEEKENDFKPPKS